CSIHITIATSSLYVIDIISNTLFRSMITKALNKRNKHDITILYSNKTPQDAPFLEECEQMAKEHGNFHFVPVMTRTSEDEWDGESGHIDADMLKRHVDDVAKPIYYLSGPANMVQAMNDMLVEAGANEDNIRLEEFSGY